jgi:hypothetical protein
VSTTTSCKNGPVNYRVRICKTCCCDHVHIELGTYIDFESALIVNDVHELIARRYGRLSVLTPRDEPYLSQLYACKYDRNIGKPGGAGRSITPGSSSLVARKKVLDILWERDDLNRKKRALDAREDHSLSCPGDISAMSDPRSAVNSRTRNRSATRLKKNPSDAQLESRPPMSVVQLSAKGGAAEFAWAGVSRPSIQAFNKQFNTLAMENSAAPPYYWGSTSSNSTFTKYNNVPRTEQSSAPLSATPASANPNPNPNTLSSFNGMSTDEFDVVQTLTELRKKTLEPTVKHEKRSRTGSVESLVSDLGPPSPPPSPPPPSLLHHGIASSSSMNSADTSAHWTDRSTSSQSSICPPKISKQTLNAACPLSYYTKCANSLSSVSTDGSNSCNNSEGSMLSEASSNNNHANNAWCTFD